MVTEVAENKMLVKGELPSSLGLIFLPQAASLCPSIPPSFLSLYSYLPRATFLSFLHLFPFLPYTHNVSPVENSEATFIFFKSVGCVRTVSKNV